MKPHYGKYNRQAAIRIPTRMACPVGRPFKLEHPTCRSCSIDCRERHGAAPVKLKQEPIRVHVVGPRLITTAYLDSLNEWNNKPRYRYMNVRKKWEKILHGAFHIWGPAKGKRLLRINRLVKDRRHLIMDRDNLVASAKPVKDVLVRCNVLVDDSDEYLDFTVGQDVDSENPRTEIILI